MLLLFSHTFPHSHNGGTFNMVNVITEHIKDVIYWSRRRRRYYCRYTNSKCRTKATHMDAKAVQHGQWGLI